MRLLVQGLERFAGEARPSCWRAGARAAPGAPPPAARGPHRRSTRPASAAPDQRASPRQALALRELVDAPVQVAGVDERADQLEPPRRHSLRCHNQHHNDTGYAITIQPRTVVIQRPEAAMNPTMTLLYLEANRAEPSGARAAGTRSRRTFAASGAPGAGSSRPGRRRLSLPPGRRRTPRRRRARTRPRTAPPGAVVAGGRVEPQLQVLMDAAGARFGPPAPPPRGSRAGRSSAARDRGGPVG